MSMVCDWCGCSLPGGGRCLDCFLGLNHNPAPPWGELLTKAMIMTVPGPMSFLQTSPRSREFGGPVLVPYLWHYTRRFGLQ